MPLEVIVPPVADHVTAVLLVPLTVTLNCTLLPVGSDVEFGVNVMLIVGGGEAAEVMANVTVLDLSPVLASMTLTVAVPATATSAWAMVATACVELTIRVGRWPPFHSTTQVPVKFEPVTVRLPANHKSRNEQIPTFFTVFPGRPPWEEGRNRLPFRAEPLG